VPFILTYGSVLSRSCSGGCYHAQHIYGCTFLPKVQEVIDSSGNVPKCEPNEESVQGRSSKDDAGNSTTSDSNVECAPPSEKGDS
jgi:hypothetical protein